jgi:hypothetical protein
MTQSEWSVIAVAAPSTVPIEAVKRGDSKSLTSWRRGNATASATFNQMPTILEQDGRSENGNQAP